MPENLVLAIAHHRVHRYAGDATIRGAQSSDCHDCEAFLAAGIDAYKWLRRAVETMREADYEGIASITPDAMKAIEGLYRAWMSVCELADEWIASLEKSGLRPGNVSDFHVARAEIEEIVQRRDWQNLATSARVLSATDETW